MIAPRHAAYESRTLWRSARQKAGEVREPVSDCIVWTALAVWYGLVAVGYRVRRQTRRGATNGR